MEVGNWVNTGTGEEEAAKHCHYYEKKLLLTTNQYMYGTNAMWRNSILVLVETNGRGAEDGGVEMGQNSDWGGGSGEVLPLVWKKCY